MTGTSNFKKPSSRPSWQILLSALLAVALTAYFVYYFSTRFEDASRTDWEAATIAFVIGAVLEVILFWAPALDKPQGPKMQVANRLFFPVTGVSTVLLPILPMAFRMCIAGIALAFTLNWTAIASWRFYCTFSAERANSR